MKAAQVLSSVLTLVTATLIFGCSHKTVNNTVEQQAAIPETQAVIEEKAMSFDLQGSDSGTIPDLFTVYFDFDHADLTTKTRATLKANYDWMRAHPSFEMTIEGHCDHKGSIEYNLALGQRRADSVRRYLVSLGMDPSKLTTISYGKEKMISRDDTDKADSLNRRANFVPRPGMRNAQN
jgi:peptidoglycan-associated lipoprotein